ncbi:MAG: GIY-YIG nuclease family protein [Candidatus Coproplasma sp.]
MSLKQSYVYILFNKPYGVLYTVVTSDIVRRISEHKQKLIHGFTSRYNVDKLGYFELFENVNEAILREKQIKAGSRAKKIELIISMNPNWEDLYDTLV